jgi:hypothetical protein
VTLSARAAEREGPAQREGEVGADGSTVYWCAGVYASGSTWAFNVMRGIAAALHPGKEVRGRFVNVLTDLDGIDDDAVVHVVKTHDVPPEVAAQLLTRATRIVATIRDPRDAITSLILYQRFGFAAALDWVGRSAKFVAGLAADPRALLLRYEDGFIETPATLDRIAQWFGGTLDPAERDRLFAAHTRAAVETLIATFDKTRDDGIGDAKTQWHRHHAGRSGEVGRWRRMLTPDRAAAAEQELRTWLQGFGYATTIWGKNYALRVGTFSLKM